MIKYEMREAGMLTQKSAKTKKENIVYQPWVLGYNKDECCTGFEFCFGQYDTAEEAIKRMEEVTVKDIGVKIPKDVKFLCWQVETVKVYKNRNWEENIDTIMETWTNRRGE